jgi:23S rRNA G2445 N2-methylase RlmL
VHPGLEKVTAQEIAARLPRARVVEQRRGWVVLRYTGDAADLLDLRTTEDVFALLYRTADLPPNRRAGIPLLTRMAQRSRHWDQAMAAFYQAKRRTVKRVTFRVVAQMTGKLGYRRQEVRDAVLSGVSARWARWKPVADDAHIEIWAPVVSKWALLAVRLSDQRMRHRTYKREHLPASLRPTLAAAMVFLSRPRADDRFCDPMCGAGTILAERALSGPYRQLLGGDLDPGAVRASRANLAPWCKSSTSAGGDCVLHLWDARALAVRSGSLDVIVSNLPFGHQVGSQEDNPALYRRFLQQVARTLRTGGRAVLLSSEKDLMRELVHDEPALHMERQVLVGVLGRAARIYSLRRY